MIESYITGRKKYYKKNDSQVDLELIQILV